MEYFYEEFREPCSLRGTGEICTIKLLDGFAVHRACDGVVGFTINDGTKDCEVLSNAKWPQRAKAMKSKDGHPTSSCKPKCAHFTFRAVECSHRGGAVEERANRARST